MAYIGKVPTAVPLSTNDLEDSIVTSAKITDGTIALADLSATGTKDATTFLRGDNTFAEAGGGSLVKLHSITTTDATTTNIDFDSTYINSTYKNYLAIINIKPATDSVELRLRFSVSGSFRTGASDYGVGFMNEGGGSTNNNALNYLIISQSTIGNASGEGCNLALQLMNLGSNTLASTINFNSSIISNGHVHAQVFGGGSANYQEVNDGIRFYLSSGNFASDSTITLYGYEK